jgi:hypothetical protein
MAGIIVLTLVEIQIQREAKFLPPIPFKGKQPFWPISPLI